MSMGCELSSLVGDSLILIAKSLSVSPYPSLLYCNPTYISPLDFRRGTSKMLLFKKTADTGCSVSDLTAGKVSGTGEATQSWTSLGLVSSFTIRLSDIGPSGSLPICSFVSFSNCSSGLEASRFLLGYVTSGFLAARFCLKGWSACSCSVLT